MYVTDPYCSEWECWPEGRPIEHPSLDDCVASPYPHMDLPLEAYKDIPEDNTMHCPQESHQETLWRGDNVPVQYWSGSKDVMRPWRGYGMRSRNLGQITSWHVRNSATEKVNIYWVGFNGAEKLQRTLTPKDRLSVRTIQGHVFTARSTRTNELLMVHTVGARVVRNINNVQCNSTQDITGRHPETPQIGESGSDRPLNCNFITTVFRNDVDCALAAYYDTGDKEILAFEIERRRNSQDDDVERKQGGGDNPAAAHYNFELTFITHTFRFRTLQGELVEEHYIDRDYVVDCPGSKSSSSSSNNNNNNVIRTQLHHSQKNKDYNNAATKPKSASSINDYDTSNVTSNNEGFSIAASSAEDVGKRDDNDDRDTTAEMHTFLIYAPGINCTECEYRSKVIS